MIFRTNTDMSVGPLPEHPERQSPGQRLSDGFELITARSPRSPRRPRLRRADSSKGEEESNGLFVRSANNVRVCLRVYSGPPLHEFPVSVIRAYVVNKIARGRKTADIARKLEILEREFPLYSAAFNIVRYFTALGPSKALPIPWPPPARHRFDRVVMSAATRMSRKIKGCEPPPPYTPFDERAPLL
ncbi:hypothetical protein Q8F55_008178 [Vanrija albida]|uniref:Uncharacterized protein n=1 Tax=Vanrija albida TaxID=181172 RepID=A0ABR3PVJ5_9TREE